MLRVSLSESHKCVLLLQGEIEDMRETLISAEKVEAEFFIR